MDFFSNTNIQLYLLAYIVGSIPFGMVLAKLFAKVDIRNSGSGSIGATNVLRVLKETNPKLAKKLAIATIILDALKGVFVLLFAMAIGIENEILWTLAVMAVLGHCFSAFLMFEGGKGVATGMGVMMFMLPFVTLGAIAVWALSAKFIKISSLSSLLALVGLIFFSFAIHPNIEPINTHAPVIIIAFLILYKHIPNIVRLLQGKEGRVV